MKLSISYYLVMLIASSTLLVVVPAIASDYTLGIFGNANMDDTIDELDIEYVRGIIDGTNEPTLLADANYDGVIDEKDIVQIELIIRGEEKELTIVDSADRIVTVKKPVERIIVLVDPHADAIRMLKLEGKVVGIGEGLAGENILLPVQSQMPSVGNWMNPDCEAIIALRPDIVMIFPGVCVELEETLEPAGITVIRLTRMGPEIVIEELRKLGYIFDRKDEAEEYIEWYTDYTDIIRDRTKGLSKDDAPRIYIEFHPKPDVWSYQAMSKDSWMNAQCIVASGRNIAADIAGVATTVDPEWVLEQNPDIVIAVVGSALPSGYGVDDVTAMKAVQDTAMSIPELQNINAVKNGRVYLVASDISNGIQMISSITYLAKWFHPELFEDLDPQAIHQEYLKRFQRIDYDITEHGVFVYPPLEV